MGTNAASTIAVIDDLATNLKLLTAILSEAGYRVATFLRGEEALKSMADEPPALVLLDMSMPGMDGIEVCRRMKADPRLAEIPVLFISALAETSNKVKALAIGGVDYVTKPFQVEEVLARVRTHLKLSRLQAELARQNQHLERLVAEKVKQIAEAQLATIFALAKLTERRDNETGDHLERVQNYARILAEALRESPLLSGQIDDEFITNLFHATPLHDIGKVAVPDAILLKPGRLTPEEFEVMKTHTVVGTETLRAVLAVHHGDRLLAMGMEITRSHHERWDGQGYPDGLVGEAIPLSARIMSVADVYDAVRSRRIYKPPFSHEESRATILAASGKQFDPAVVDAFLKIEGRFRSLSAEAEARL